jgi:hypothetical protein
VVIAPDAEDWAGVTWDAAPSPVAVLDASFRPTVSSSADTADHETATA